MKSTKQERQVYHTPQVMDYGNVKQITMALANTSSTNDGGTKGNRKTQ